MKLEIHKCDRCSRKIEVPDDTVRLVIDPNAQFVDEGDTISVTENAMELCCLCHESLKDWFAAREPFLPGVIDNEKRIQNERVEESQDI